MNKLALAVTVAAIAVVPVAHADTAALAKEKQCLTCHTAKKDGERGPSFKAIAEKYKGLSNASAVLVQKVKVGGEGHWGTEKMPGGGKARPAVSEDEAKELVNWVLGQ